MSTKISEDFKYEIATVVEHGFSLISEKKTPCAWFEFQFDKIRSDQNEYLTVRAYLYLTEKALDFSLEKLAALGWTGTDICELDPNEEVGFNFIGRQALITGGMQNYKGKNRAVVNFINDLNYQPIKSATSPEFKEINAKLKGKIAAYRSKNQNVNGTEQPIFPDPEPVIPF